MSFMLISSFLPPSLREHMSLVVFLLLLASSLDLGSRLVGSIELVGGIITSLSHQHGRTNKSAEERATYLDSTVGDTSTSWALGSRLLLLGSRCIYHQQSPQLSARLDNVPGRCSAPVCCLGAPASVPAFPTIGSSFSCAGELVIMGYRVVLV
jgi:hypothetical protein